MLDGRVLEASQVWSTLKGLVGEGAARRGSPARREIAATAPGRSGSVAVVGNAQAVGGLAVGGGGKVGADPGGQPGARVRALGQQRPVQRAQRGAAPVRREESRPGGSCRRRCRPGGSCTASRASLCKCRSSSKSLSEPATLLRLSTYFKPCADQRGTSKQLLAQEAERRSHRLLFPMRNALQSACRTFHSSASGSRRKGSCRVPASPVHTTGRAAPSAAGR